MSFRLVRNLLNKTPSKVKRIENKYFSTISTGKLNTLLHFHRPPINLIICQGSFLPCGRSRSYLGDGFPLRCFQRLSDGNLATQRCPISSEQLAHQGFPHPSPLVLGTNLLKSQTGIQDRDRTVLRRSEPSSRTALTGEQPDPWNLLQLQDAMSRHRGAKPHRRCGRLDAISLLSPG